MAIYAVYLLKHNGMIVTIYTLASEFIHILKRLYD